MNTRKFPEPEIVTCQTEYGAAYGWKIEAYGLYILGNTKLDCCIEFADAYQSEYDKPFHPALA